MRSKSSVTGLSDQRRADKTELIDGRQQVQIRRGCTEERAGREEIAKEEASTVHHAVKAMYSGMRCSVFFLYSATEESVPYNYIRQASKLKHWRG